MTRYRTTAELYLTFLSHHDSYMLKVPKDSVIEYDGIDMLYEGKRSIDYFEFNQQFLVLDDAVPTLR